MRKVTTEGMVQKVYSFLVDNEYQTAEQLAKKCGMKPCSIYRIIRMMRLGSIGVLTTNRGYVLAEYARKTDDVNFMRRLYGRKVSDYISAKAAERHIMRRWKGIEQKEELRIMMGPLTADITRTSGMKVLLTKVEPKRQRNLLLK